MNQIVKPDVSLILTAHREGLLSGISARSLIAARDHATNSGLRCETLVTLDNADDLTQRTLRGALGDSARFFDTKLGDPGLVRNFAVLQAQGRFSTFLDADDLWSRNWVQSAVVHAMDRPDAIVQSACNIFFGNSNGIWWHVDSESPLFDPGYLRWMNYWDAMTLAETELYCRFPFRKNEIKEGYGHEDWHWNIITVGAGIPHKPVPGTVHFKRRRHGTQSDKVEQNQGMPFAEPDVLLDRTFFKQLLSDLASS